MTTGVAGLFVDQGHKSGDRRDVRQRSLYDRLDILIDNSPVFLR